MLNIFFFWAERGILLDGQKHTKHPVIGMFSIVSQVYKNHTQNYSLTETSLCGDWGGLAVLLS